MIYTSYIVNYTEYFEIAVVGVAVVALAEANTYSLISNYFRIFHKYEPGDWHTPHKAKFWQKLILFLHAFTSIGKNSKGQHWETPLYSIWLKVLSQCRKYHREQLSNGSTVGRSLGSTCGGQRTEPYCCVKDYTQGPFLKDFSLTLMLFALERTPSFCLPKVKPSDLPTFVPFESCSL
jgi:hypothetical protein